MTITKTQRFVKEYAYWKVEILQDMAKSHPERANTCKAHAAIVRETYLKWDKGLVTTDEAMAKISEY